MNSESAARISPAEAHDAPNQDSRFFAEEKCLCQTNCCLCDSAMQAAVGWIQVAATLHRNSDAGFPQSSDAGNLLFPLRRPAVLYNDKSDDDDDDNGGGGGGGAGGGST